MNLIYFTNIVYALTYHWGQIDPHPSLSPIVFNELMLLIIYGLLVSGGIPGDRLHTPLPDKLQPDGMYV